MMIDRYIDVIRETTKNNIDEIRKNTTIIDIENIAQWLIVESPEEYDDFNDFPNLMLPWPVTWMEFPIPILINNGGIIRNNPARRYAKHIGVMCLATEYENYFINDYIVFCEYHQKEMLPLARVIMNIDKLGKINEQDVIYDNMLIPTGMGRYGWPSSVRAAKINYPNMTINEINLHLSNNAVSAMAPIFFAISLLHCKNIKMVERNIDKKLNDKRIKKGKHPFFRFNTIEINPMKEVLKIEGKSEKTGLKKALHICRGHFATYTQDAPLFGRVTGTFWKPMHIRGNKKEGIVIKDYKIKAPKANYGENH